MSNPLYTYILNIGFENIIDNIFKPAWGLFAHC